MNTTIVIYKMNFILLSINYILDTHTYKNLALFYMCAPFSTSLICVMYCMGMTDFIQFLLVDFTHILQGYFSNSGLISMYLCKIDDGMMD